MNPEPSASSALLVAPSAPNQITLAHLTSAPLASIAVVTSSFAAVASFNTRHASVLQAQVANANFPLVSDNTHASCKSNPLLNMHDSNAI